MSQLVRSTWDTLNTCTVHVGWGVGAGSSLECHTDARGALLGGGAACMLPSTEVSRFPTVEERNPCNLGEQKFGRCEEEQKVQYQAWKVTVGAPHPPGKCCLCTGEGQGCLLLSLVAWCGSCAGPIS